MNIKKFLSKHRKARFFLCVWWAWILPFLAFYESFVKELNIKPAIEEGCRYWKLCWKAYWIILTMRDEKVGTGFELKSVHTDTKQRKNKHL